MMAAARLVAAVVLSTASVSRGTSGVSRAAAAPPAAPPCHLNGERGATGQCICDPGWTGAQCGQLDLLPAPPLSQQVSPAAALSNDNDAANATWGISVVGPVAGVYHGYMTEIANECLLGEYGVASQVVHMTASAPLGPWTRQGVALAGFAHNPQAILAPNGSVLLFHIGQQLAPGCLADCRGTAPHGADPHPPKARPKGCTSPSHAASVAMAQSPAGPFTRYPYAFPSSATNPAAMLLSPNGTIVVALRRGTSSKQPLYIGHVDSPAGPWRPLSATVLPTAAGSPSKFDQDPYIFRNRKRGSYHIINNRQGSAARHEGCPAACMSLGKCFSPCPDKSGSLCGIGHLYSEDLRTWFFGEYALGPGGAAAAQCDVTFEGGGSQTRLTSRERPTMFTDAVSGRSFLFTGASLNKTMYLHSFSLVQEIRTVKADEEA
jgi:hypothetical protein